MWTQTSSIRLSNTIKLKEASKEGCLCLLSLSLSAFLSVTAVSVANEEAAALIGRRGRALITTLIIVNIVCNEIPAYWIIKGSYSV